MTRPAPELSPIERNTVFRFGIHNDDILNAATALTTTLTPTTPALAAAPEPTPVLACHLDCARQAIKTGCLPTSTLTDYRVFSTGESVRGAQFTREPLRVVAAGHMLRDGLVLSAVAAGATISADALRVARAIEYIYEIQPAPYPDSMLGTLLGILQGTVAS